MRNTQSENIAEHSLEVAVIAHLLANIKNLYFRGSIDPEHVAIIAIFHDFNETITGDLPTPIKYFNPEIKVAYKKLERIANEKIMSMLPKSLSDKYHDIFFNVDKEINDIIKAADKLSAYIKCIEEEKAGNTEFRKAKESIYNQIKDYNMPEVEYFLKEFIPSVNLTLDELD